MLYFPWAGLEMDKLFVHLLTLEEWVSVGDIAIPPQEDVAFWRCATLDSSLWEPKIFSDLICNVPTLGLLDCRNSITLAPHKNKLDWLKNLSSGNLEIRAFRIRAVLVPSRQWPLMETTLKRIGRTLERLELDFCGKPYREWRNVLTTLSDMPNLTEFILRGCFIDDKPVLDWLHGQLPSLRLLDLRDCTMSMGKQVSLESLKTLLLELKESLRSVSLPPLPKCNCNGVFEVLAKLVNLREVGLHARDLDKINRLTGLECLEVYSGRGPCVEGPTGSVLAGQLRKMSDCLRSIEELTLRENLIRSQLVREAIVDVLPNLKKLHVINVEKKLRTSFEGPKCRDFNSWM